ncbi:MAG TPA: apolipoprotein N-acyltransferase [Myxococcaceae bacterium]|nr:apolipoprotein N-acyltransferase [Myxococcaceae bacterium]
MSAVALPPPPEPTPAPGSVPARPERLLVPWRLGALVLSGLLGAAAFPIAFPVGPRRELFASGILEPLAFVCLVPLLLAIRRLSPWRAFWAGQLGGMVFFTGAFWWVNVAMVTFGGMPNWLSIPALELLVAWCAFHWALAAGLLRLLERGLGWSMGWTVGPVWMASELMRNYFCSGFPWANLGYTQTRNLWFHQVASLGGVYGIALAVAVVNGALYEGWRWRRLRERPMPRALLAVAAAVLVLGHVYGAFHVRAMDRAAAAAPRLRAAVIQANIDQKLKMGRGSSRAATILGRYLPPTDAADQAGADLIVWPEGSYPLAFPTGVTRLTDVGLRPGGYRAGLLVGVDVYDPKNLRKGNENAAFLLDPTLGIAHHYVKNHLVPFGEYVPLNMDEVLPIGNIVGASFTPGNDLSPAVLRRADAPPVRLAIEICYDAIFPEISRTYARNGAQVLVNMTNDAWYGFSSAPFQFLHMVASRAVETGRPVARAANTGVSAFIDPVGRISDATDVGIVPSDRLAVSAAELTGPEWRMAELPLLEGRTPYVVIGDVPAYLAALFAGLSGLVALIRLRRARP